MARLHVAILRPVFLTVLFAFPVCTWCVSSIQALQEAPAETSGPPTRRNSTIPKSCPITKSPVTPFAPPAPYPRDLCPGGCWIGTHKLWTNLPAEGTWKGLRQKTFWWREGYDWRAENPPPLRVTGRRLDGKAPLFEPVRANAGWTNDSNHPFMVVAFDIPTLGCWEITGDYKGDKLTFIVWVAP